MENIHERKPKQYFSGDNTSKQWTLQHQEEQTQSE